MCRHNSKAFDCVHSINALVLIKVVITEFHKVIFAYTLPFYGLSTDRLCRKENKLKLLYSQEALFHDIVGGGGVVHDSLMQSVMFNQYNQLSKNVTKSVYCRITIHLHSCPQLHIILRKRNDNSETFRAIATEKCAFYDVLCEEINNKPRVTKNKVVIAKKNHNK